jgi:SAM-dependent methyltransferase
MAEGFMDACWSEIVWPMVSDCDFSVVVDLAAGHGRNSEKLRRLADRIHVVDIVAENVEFCRRRFAGDGRFEYHLCDGMTFPRVPDASVSLVYCFDAMVHFDSDTVRSYPARDTLRASAGRPCLLPPLQLCGQPDRGLSPEPPLAELHVQRALRALGSQGGLSVLRAKVVDWGADAAPSLDCLTVLERARG